MTDAGMTAALAAPAPATTSAPDRMRQAAEAFEAFFLTQVLEHMSTGLKTDGAFGGGPAEGAWRSMLNEQYATTMARRGGTGIADYVYREMLRIQEMAS